MLVKSLHIDDELQLLSSFRQVNDPAFARGQVFTLCSFEGKSHKAALTMSNQPVKANKSVPEYITVANGASIAVLLLFSRF